MKQRVRQEQRKTSGQFLQTVLPLILRICCSAGAGVALWIAATHPSSVRRLALWGIPLLNEEWQKKLANEAPPTYSKDGSELAQQWTLLCEGYPGMNFGRKVDFLVGALQTKETKAWAHRAIGRADIRSLIEQVSGPAVEIKSRCFVAVCRVSF